MSEQKITPCLWFDPQAKEAVDFYASLFQNSQTSRTSCYGKEGYEVHGMPKGTVLTVDFKLGGCEFTALNGGSEQHGWLKDQFGVSWQIVPEKLDALINGQDKERSEQVMKAMLQMKKLDIDKLEKVYQS